MGTVPWTVYAPTRRREHWKLPDGLSWKTVERKVKRLQMRIAKAAKEGNYRSMRSLQWLLAHSRLAKLLAIRRVTSNKGKSTPGVDGVVWRTSRQKMRAVKQLSRRGYRALPLRRVYIRKKSGKLRPLGIPTMRDRAMQALYALTLAPIAETRADPQRRSFIATLRPLSRDWNKEAYWIQLFWSRLQDLDQFLSAPVTDTEAYFYRIFRKTKSAGPVLLYIGMTLQQDSVRDRLLNRDHSCRMANFRKKHSRSTLFVSLGHIKMHGSSVRGERIREVESLLIYTQEPPANTQSTRAHSVRWPLYIHNSGFLYGLPIEIFYGTSTTP